MILKAYPALKAPMLTTAEFWGSTLRDTMLFVKPQQAKKQHK